MARTPPAGQSRRLDFVTALVQTAGMSVAHRRYTIHEFVALEQYSNVRHEFLGGQIYAMAGGTPEHGLYAANVIGILTAALRGRRCRVHTSDVRIRISKTGLDTYPDVSIVCGHAELHQEDRNASTNPVALVEVLSPSAADHDRPCFGARMTLA
jgi:Uma2 family endonuclease